jgi:protein TonB
MPTHALAQGGPRPSEGLPCTLLPQAVLAAAPPSERAASAFAACLVYAALGSTLVFLGRGQGRGLTFGHRPVVVVFERADAPVLRPLPPPARFPGNSQRPPGAASTPLPAVPDQVPVVTPSALPTENHAWDGPYNPDLPLAPQGLGREEPNGPQGVAPVRALPPVAMDLKDMRVLSQVQPVYPPLARLARVQGSVELLMTVDGHGVPSEVRVLSGPHPSLCNEAFRVARLWRFEPALAQGRPVPAQFRLTVVFRLAS